MDNAFNNGVLLVASAGNDGSSIYNYPASYDSVISVSAVDSSKNWATFSNKNDQVELSAPGVDVFSTTNVVNQYYEYNSGTSMASPHVAVSTIYLSNHISFCNVPLINILIFISILYVIF